MQIKEIEHLFLKELEKTYNFNEINSLLKKSFENYNISKNDLLINKENELSIIQEEGLINILYDLKSQKPIQYILGKETFYGLEFEVNKNVLIPRPETEELVDMIIKSSNRNDCILDVGSGSGCIAISLAKEIPNSEIYSIDISEKALNTAIKNAINNNVVVNFIHADIFSIKNIVNKKFDIIVSNPPYITEKEKKMMKANVLENEPFLALFVPDLKPLLFYDAILKFAINNLNENGKIFFEINENFGKKMIDLAKNYSYQKIQLIKDFLGKDRFLKIIK